MDDMDILGVLRNILELGWPGIVMAAIWVVWREYKRRTDEFIANLREEMLSLKRQNEILLGIVLDQAKLAPFDPQRKTMPARSEMRQFDDVDPDTKQL